MDRRFCAGTASRGYLENHRLADATAATADAGGFAAVILPRLWRQPPAEPQPCAKLVSVAGARGILPAREAEIPSGMPESAGKMPALRSSLPNQSARIREW